MSNTKRPRVVAVPGFGGAGGDFMPLVERLPSCDWQLLTWPGCDGTSYVDPQFYQKDRLCGWLESVVRPTDVVFGYSMGGRLTLECMARGMELRAAIIVAAVPGIPSEKERRLRKDADDILAASILGMEAADFAEKWSQHPLIQTQRRIESPYREQMRARRDRNNTRALSDALRSFGQGVIEPKWEAVAERVLPALLVTGVEDTKYTDLVGKFAAEWTSASHVILGGGHAAHLEAPGEMTEALASFFHRLGFVD